jgi:hypothetical protein
MIEKKGEFAPFVSEFIEIIIIELITLALCVLPNESECLALHN